MKRYKKIYLAEFTKDGKEPPFVRVSYIDAKEPVELDGDARSALAGAPGKTIGCALSNVFKKNADKFPHRVGMVSVTKSSCYVTCATDERGLPSKAVRYDHSYSHIVEANDRGTLKKMLEEQPDLMERKLRLRVPRKRFGSWQGEKKSSGPRRSPVVLRGALERARAAGLMAPEVAKQLGLK